MPFAEFKVRPRGAPLVRDTDDGGGDDAAAAAAAAAAAVVVEQVVLEARLGARVARVPVMFLDGAHLGGYEELCAWLGVAPEADPQL